MKFNIFFTLFSFIIICYLMQFTHRAVSEPVDGVLHQKAEIIPLKDKNEFKLLNLKPKIYPSQSVEGWRGLVSKYDWPVDTVLRIMDCESRGNPNAVGDTSTAYSSYGLMQIRALPGRPSPSWLLNPENNISYAYEIYKGQGFTPWTCY